MHACMHDRERLGQLGQHHDLVRSITTCHTRSRREKELESSFESSFEVIVPCN